MIAWKDPKATDSGGRPLKATCKPVSGSQFPVGSRQVACKAVDKENREALCTFEVNIKGKYKTKKFGNFNVMQLGIAIRNVFFVLFCFLFFIISLQQRRC